MRRPVRAAVSTLSALLALVALVLLAPLLPADPTTGSEHAVRWVWGALLLGVAGWGLVLMYRNGTSRRPGSRGSAPARDED
ncbi:hypothetical protein JL107_08900 [Nakamurella flavida]|uniref:Uncharacterized protein n=1 Tax=Nakamurella flavida TaxID=363630 RepID=A0A938YP00_9ACTN|nr:hypothetical protein [Nakamurella flavida]MBM9476558.1 hypothetical protein [Nakamurella flavida]MDP9779004.1 branched-subunit amino acid ABC-type transport system permease component [Nakamurella flavida]